MRVLGISPFHDSSVAVINDGQIEFFLKEERLTKIKRDIQPWVSINTVLKKYAVEEIDHVIVAPPHNEIFNDFLFTYLHKTFGQKIADMSNEHHLQHASLAFYNSGFDKALVVVVDRNGSYVEGLGFESESVFVASYPCSFEKIYQNFWKDNELGIVKVYESATSLINQHPLENGKTMGLSSYGQNKPFVDLFDESGKPKHELFGGTNVKNFGSNMVTILKENAQHQSSDINPTNYQLYADYAFQVQKQSQQQVLNLIEKTVKDTGIKKVCITGGYGLNVVANNFYLENCPDIEFYFEPLADDSGNSAGGAMFLYRNISQDTTIIPLDNTFKHGSPHKIETEGLNIDYDGVVELLLAQKTVGVFNGLAEIGPRALGNRSLIFDPRNPEGKTIVNKIKNREWYRPFGAVMLEEEFLKYFETCGQLKNEYMTVSFKAKQGVKELIPSVIHVDNTCRLQTVSEGHMFELLKEFKKETGIGILLNTSLNLAGLPLVESETDALRMLDESELDYLWFVESKQIV